MTMKKLSFCICTALLATACGKEEAPPAPVTDIAAGKALVEDQCVGCHTLEGGGKTEEIPNLAGQPEAYLAEAMHAYRSGQRHHAALQDLIAEYSEADIRNIAGYFASLPPVPLAAVAVSTETTYLEGKEVAEACIDCHGEQGFSQSPGVPNLAGQHPMYLIVATQDYAEGKRDNAEKEAMLSGLGQVDIEKMAMYFAAQVPAPREAPPFGDVAAGEPLTAMCGSCHGARGVSDDPMVPNLAGQEPHYLVDAMKAYRDHQRSHEDMVADRSDVEIEHIAAFYSVQQAGAITLETESVEEIIAKCDRCHGQIMGESTMVVPVLHGQKQEYLLHVMKEYRDGERGNPMMHKMSAGYSDRVLAEIAQYYATHAER